MNTINAVLRRTEFAREPHLVIAVDGVSLDAVLDRIHPDRRLNGLVPTLLDWIIDDRDRAVAWGRVLPGVGDRQVAPVLMCPDDLDFSCTVIVADVVQTPVHVIWERVGIDRTDSTWMSSENVGRTVEWLDGVGPYHFDPAAYRRMVDAFRRTDPPVDTA